MEYGSDDVLPDEAKDWPAITLTPAEADELELLLTATLPVTAYLTEKEYASVQSGGRLPGGSYVARPITLARRSEMLAGIAPGSRVALQDGESVPLAVLPVTDVWPGSHGDHHLAGAPAKLRAPSHGPFRSRRQRPDEVRRALGGSRHVLAVPVVAPVDRPQLARLAELAQNLSARLLLLPLVGGDHLPAVHRGRSALAAAEALAERPLVVPVGLPPSRDVAGEHLVALVAAAYGASSVLLSAAAAEQAPADLPVTVLPEPTTSDGGATGLSVGATSGDPTTGSPRATRAVGRPEAASAAAHAGRGVVVFFTGLSGSGKSTLARTLRDRLVEEYGLPVSLLDGDEVRQLLSSGLTFSRADRDLNIRRIGFVAAEIARHGGIAICAPIAPYAGTRAEVRRMVTAAGGELILVHVATPLEVCERRDRKGMYAKARAGLIPEFTGVSDPYEEPSDADFVIDTTDASPDDVIQPIVERLRALGFLEGAAS